MSDESAELLQLDPERHVTARSCVQLKHARVTADERRNLFILTLVHAVHAAHTCALCVVYAAALLSLSSGRSVPLAVHDTEVSIHSTPHTSPGAKGASSIYSGAAAKHAQARSFTVTLCVRTTNLTARPRLCTSQVSSQASRAWLAGYGRSS